MSQTTWTEEDEKRRRSVIDITANVLHKTRDCECEAGLILARMKANAFSTRDEIAVALTRLMNRETGGGNG